LGKQRLALPVIGAMMAIDRNSMQRWPSEVDKLAKEKGRLRGLFGVV
jgi:hypothetical protein